MQKKRFKCTATNKRKVRLVQHKRVAVPQTLYSISFDNTWKKNVRESYMCGESKEQKIKTLKAMSLL